MILVDKYHVSAMVVRYCDIDAVNYRYRNKILMVQNNNFYPIQHQKYNIECKIINDLNC